ncbi:Predicted amidohydrolase [Bryocella elongata]|uniref:Predicted amidohydrolase n=1 Tax=Bryocella elongata TaxID=863522 RepID=A0A1H5YFM2_9BACT|nr:carbon-nitrogen hydrolase family protein [Bryocella elongata]SEG22495.1 Predicted amidohydrolase [Bryocella elongata]
MIVRAAVTQVGSALSSTDSAPGPLFDTPATLARVEDCCRRARAGGAQLIVLPEALLGGYPKGLSFGAVVGSRSDEGRELFRRYFDSAITVPGPEIQALAALSRELELHIVLGVIERDGGTLYCTGLLFTPERGLHTRHRKLMPTASERLLWGMGDGSTMQVADTSLGRIGMAICWENYMPLYRQHLYRQGVQIWCAPTVDMREIWQTSMRHIAYEGRCFVLSACQELAKSDWPEELRDAGGEIAGRSLIVSPRGELLAGPAEGATLAFADLDMDEIARGKFDLDVAGHYDRPDVFELRVRAASRHD